MIINTPVNYQTEQHIVVNLQIHVLYQIEHKLIRTC
jgi:hypothetical protein